MALFGRYPILPNAKNHSVAGTLLRIGAFQLTVEVSLTLPGCRRLPDGTSRFPAVLDTGHSHNFSIRQSHLEDFAGVRPDDLVRLRSVKLRDSSGIEHRIAAFDADIWLHPRRADADPVRLELDGGFTCYQDHDPIPGPPFPLVGARGLVTAGISLAIDYNKLLFSIEFP